MPLLLTDFDILIDLFVGRHYLSYNHRYHFCYAEIFTLESNLREDSNLLSASFNPDIISGLLTSSLPSLMKVPNSGNLNFPTTFPAKKGNEFSAIFSTELPPFGPGVAFSNRIGFPLKKPLSIRVNQSKIFLKKAGKFPLCSGIVEGPLHPGYTLEYYNREEKECRTARLKTKLYI